MTAKAKSTTNRKTARVVGVLVVIGTAATILGKVHYSLITLAALVFIWWANYWNLLGWRF